MDKDTKSQISLINIIRAKNEMEYEQCPFCYSFSVDVNYVDGRKASPSECLDCGASEIHPYYDNEESLKEYDILDKWKKEKNNNLNRKEST